MNWLSTKEYPFYKHGNFLLVQYNLAIYFFPVNKYIINAQ